MRVHRTDNLADVVSCEGENCDHNVRYIMFDERESSRFVCACHVSAEDNTTLMGFCLEDLIMDVILEDDRFEVTADGMIRLADGQVH